MANFEVGAAGAALAGTGDDELFTGTAGDDHFEGHGGNDTFLIGYGGNDNAIGAEGDDVVFVALTGTAATHVVTGAAGNDLLQLQGHGAQAVTLGESAASGNLIRASGIERIQFLSGTDASRGWQLGPSAAYTVTLKNSATSAGATVTVDASGLGAAEPFRFTTDETDAMLVVTGGNANDDLAGGALADVLTGGGGHDVLNGGAGDDRLDGGGGNDLFIYDAVSAAPNLDVVIGGTGTDELAAGFGPIAAAALTFSLTADGVGGYDGYYASGNQRVDFTGIERLGILGTNFAEEISGIGGGDTLYGQGGDDVIRGQAGADFLSGGQGVDTLIGGTGDDVYSIAAGDESDIVVELTGEGNDQVSTNLASYTLGDNVERLAGFATTGQTLTGNGLANTIQGSSGNDMLDGRSGVDALNGGAGNDIYYVDESGDTVTDSSGADEIRSSAAAYTIAASLVMETLTGLLDSGQSLTGNGGANTLRGGGGADILSGMGGADIMWGGAGNDQIDGGTGDDVMRGEAGDDSYSVDSASDSVVENAGEGIDTVLTTLSAYTLGATLENLTGIAIAAQELRGNALDNVVRGSWLDDLLRLDDGGVDQAFGGLGGDVLYFGSAMTSADEADGGGGAGDWLKLQGDYSGGLTFGAKALVGIELLQLLGRTNTLYGGSGAAPNHYKLTTLDANVAAGTQLNVNGSDLATDESLVFDGSAESDGTFAINGGRGADILIAGAGGDYVAGGSGNDLIDGRGGGDFMVGGPGDDVFIVDHAGDTVNESAGAGTDEVRTGLVSYVLAANVENLTGTAAVAQTLRGNALDNVVNGGSASDTIYLQDGGADKAFGNGGPDQIYFGGTLTAADTADGGAGDDWLILQGDYSSGLVFSAGMMTGFEHLQLLGGTNTSYGGASANPNSYTITTHDSNVGPTGWFAVDGGSLGANESLIFDGSGDTDGRFWVIGGAGADRLTGSGGNDLLDGGAGADTLIGGLGNDVYNADNGDTIVEAANGGTDYVETRSATFTLAANIETLIGELATGQILIGNSGDNVIEGDSGADTLDGGGGIDTLKGNDGNDILRASAPGRVWAQGGAGSDILKIDWSAATAAIVNSFIPTFAVGPEGFSIGFADWGAYSVSGFGIDSVDITTGSGNDVIKTGPGNDRVLLNGGDDLLDAGSGTNVADGGTGIDGLDVDLSGATAAIAWNIAASSHGGVAGSYTNFEYFAKLRTGSGNDTIVTGAGERAELIYTNAGNDSVSVFGGSDTVSAGPGLDTLIIDYSAAVEAIVALGIVDAAEGMSGTFGDSGAHKVDFSGIDRFVFTGGKGGDSLITGGGDDVMSGGEGDDNFTANGGNDSLTGGAGNDILGGGAGNDSLIGGAGNDRLDGGAGADSMTGGAGDDVYVVDSLSDVASETEGEGTDRISTSLASYVLGAAFEELAGTSEAGQTLAGNGGDNVIDARTGDDVIDGGAGADRMTGGSGNDVYHVDNFGDAVVELAQAGLDEVRTGLAAYALGANVENLTGIGAEGQALTGNGTANRISGAAGDDVLDGGAGADSMAGGEGDDLYLVDHDGDTATEALDSGIDTVRTTLDVYTLGDNFENLTATSATGQMLIGNSGANVISGGAGDDILTGGAGDDTLDGGGGSDILRGGEGDDLFNLVGTGSPSTLVVEGGDGNDRLSFSAPDGGAAAIDMGAGDDRVEIEQLVGGSARIRLGTGQDSMVFAPAALQQAGNQLGAVVVTDFQTGAGGDSIEWPADLSSVFGGWTGTNPFASGYARLEQSGADTLLQISLGANGSFVTLVRFENCAPADFTGGNLGGWSPRPVTGGSGADQLSGTASSDFLYGEGGNDFFYLEAGGDDLAFGGSGNDVVYFGGALSAGDVADGGDGRDAIVLQGNVTAVLSDSNLAGIESISIQSGANAKFGDTANNLYDYDVTTADGNVAAGQQLIVNAQSLRAGEDFTFDGSAESDGRFLVYGGHGVDHLTGGDGVDVFFFEGQRWGANDRVDGGDGRDSLVISGGSGVTHIEFGADSFTNIESISVNNHFATDPTQKPSYELVLHNGNVAAGGTLIVNGSSIAGADQFVDIDGSGVHDGNLILLGGAGNDTLIDGDGADLLFGAGGADDLRGGAGADTFRYDSTSDSTQSATDEIAGFLSGTDRIDLSRVDANATAAGDQAFHWIGAAAFSGAAGELRAYENGGIWFVEGDTTGDGVADLVISIIPQSGAPLVYEDCLF